MPTNDDRQQARDEASKAARFRNRSVRAAKQLAKTLFLLGQIAEEQDTVELAEVTGAVDVALRAAERLVARVTGRPVAVPPSSRTCPGCSGTVGPLLNHKTIKLQPTTKLGECSGCGGLVGDMDVRDLSQFVIMEFEPDTPDAEELRYFDLTVKSPLVAERDYRTHGWYLPRTKRVLVVVPSKVVQLG